MTDGKHRRSTENVGIGVRLDPGLILRARVFATYSGTRLGAVIEDALVAHLDRHANPDGKPKKRAATQRVRKVAKTRLGGRQPRHTREKIIAALKKAKGNLTDAASSLGYNRGTFYRRLQREGIKPEDYRR